MFTSLWSGTYLSIEEAVQDCDHKSLNGENNTDKRAVTVLQFCSIVNHVNGLHCSKNVGWLVYSNDDKKIWEEWWEECVGKVSLVSKWTVMELCSLTAFSIIPHYVMNWNNSRVKNGYTATGSASTRVPGDLPGKPFLPLKNLWVRADRKPDYYFGAWIFKKI